MTASEKFVEELVGQIDHNKVDEIVKIQKEGLCRFEKTNEMLLNCSKLSTNRLETASKELMWYTNSINDMKKDLDSVFRRIRLYKQKMVQLYGEEIFGAVQVSEAESQATGSHNDCDKGAM